METAGNPYPSSPLQQTVRKGTGWKIFFGIILGLSIIVNLVLFIALIAIGAEILIGTDTSEYFIEKVIEDGPGSSKIVVIKIEDIINNDLADEVASQIKAAKNDKNVKALIFKTITPGGEDSVSDRIYDAISRFKKETGKPAVAFMQTIATSGGFYTSAACDKIIAEPTAITGSIGVIMGHFVIQDLLEMKLGIKPVIVKSGPKKDWPTSFEPVTEEQLAYLRETLIMPAYERFVGIVAKSRKDKLTIEQIRVLADGSVYNAQQALDNKLIDEIGYMEEAVASAKSLAKITNAKVVEYNKPFSLQDWLGAKSGKSFLHFDRNTLYELTTPRLMYLWDAGLNF